MTDCPECRKRDQALALVKVRNRVLRDMITDLTRAIDRYLDLGDGDTPNEKPQAKNSALAKAPAS